MVAETRWAKHATRPTKPRVEMILDALERLLAETPLRDLGVEEIAASAGITRTRFYHYYKSKHEAYAALLRRVSEQILEVYNRADSWFIRPPDARPRESMLSTFEAIGEVWFQHAAVLREASDLWNAVPEVAEHWHEIISGLADRSKVAIERERELGVAPPGADARTLADCLIWQGERLLFLSLIDAPRAMSVVELVETCSSIWLRAIYLAEDPDPR